MKPEHRQIGPVLQALQGHTKPEIVDTGHVLEPVKEET